jgi:hypothetical protein
VQFSLDSDEGQAVKHLLDVGRLLVFTTGGVFQCGSADDGSITPTTANPRALDSSGVGRIRPLKVADSVLFVETQQSRSATCSRGRPAAPRRLQRPRSHRVRRAPLRRLHDRRLGLRQEAAFDRVRRPERRHAPRAHVSPRARALGWHRHDTDGTFENVCVVPEGREDAVYVVVRRTINGVTKRYVERFASRFFTAQRDAFFVDAAVVRRAQRRRDDDDAHGRQCLDERGTLTVTRSAAGFVADNIGDAVDFTAATAPACDSRSRPT